MENLPTVPVKIVENYPPSTCNLSFEVYSTSGHPSLEKIKKKNDPRIKIFETSCRMKDSADIYITLRLGQLMLAQVYDKIIIVSKDNFASACKMVANEHIAHFAMRRSQNIIEGIGQDLVHHFVSFEQTLEYLESLEL